MPPLTLEVGAILALCTALVKVTISVSHIEQNQKIGQAELLGEIRVLKGEITFLKDESKEMKAEFKESRRHRYSDINT